MNVNYQFLTAPGNVDSVEIHRVEENTTNKDLKRFSQDLMKDFGFCKDTVEFFEFRLKEEKLISRNNFLLLPKIENKTYSAIFQQKIYPSFTALT